MLKEKIPSFRFLFFISEKNEKQVMFFQFLLGIGTIAMKNSKQIYYEITNQFVSALKKGAPPWIKPWDEYQSYTNLPVNAATGRRYSGVNITILWAAATSYGFESDRWLTFNQAKTVGGTVRRGQKSTLAVLFKNINCENHKNIDQRTDAQDENESALQYRLIRGFNLFNVEQCKDLPTDVVEGGEPRKCPLSWETHEQAVKLLQQHNIKIHRNKKSACYVPETDHIYMPPKSAFNSTAGYYSTLFHELAHWTGHSSRLNRTGINCPSNQESMDYAFEELIAEICSAFLCAEFGIPGELRHDSYILSWIKKLENDPRAIFSASSQAWKARCFVLGESTKSNNLPQ